uniref:Unkown n=1 Tax=Lycosa singoriensis TaxID=434756 RepID=A9QQ96_LYCSI|nr:unkown [Lycosa singoriensis]
MLCSRAFSDVNRLLFTRLGRVSKMQMRPMSAPALKEPHLNDILIPHEPFEVGYKRRQRSNTMMLVFGAAFFVVSFSYVFTSGVIVPNLTPPKKNLSS